MGNRIKSIALLGICIMPAAALGQGTAFTYQGQLKNSGAPVNGTANFTFKLFDAAAAGSQQGATLTQNGLSVSNGLFTTQLDFGVNPYTANAARWLEITVNAQLLTPRQALTPTPFSLNTRGINVDASGRVGVGTTTPTEPFSVRTATTDYGFSHTDGTITLSSFVGGSTVGGWLGTKSNHPLSFFTNNSSALMTIGTSGNVGVGTSAPKHKLALAGGPSWTSNFWTGAVEMGNASAIAWQANAGGQRFGIGRSTGGLYFFRSDSDLGTTASPSIYDMTLTDAGNLGIGLSTPTLRLDVNGRSRVRQGSDPSAGIWMHHASDRAFIGMLDNDNVGFFGTGGIGWGLVMNVNDGRVAIGHANPQTALHVNGTTRTNVVEIVGADLAEKFPTKDAHAEPGTVMEIDPDHSGGLRIAREAYSPRVAGVVSGAGNLPVGAVLGHLPGNEDAPPIALSGRVWVKCDATGAAIRPGDLLTTSGMAGHAMKAADRERSHGAIIGKAMSQLERGKSGLVLVLVNLQ